jgi:hypothetical protein
MESAAKLVTVIVTIALSVVTAAPRVEFEVASVKLHTSLSIFTAIQEQLGLRLNSTKDTMYVLVIDT